VGELRAGPRRAGEPHVRFPEEPALLPGAAWDRLVILGGARTGTVTDPRYGRRGRCWPDRLVRRLREVRPELAYANLGRRELTAPKIRASQLAAALEFRPDLAVVAARAGQPAGAEPDIDGTETELARVVAALRAAGSTVVILSRPDAQPGRPVGAAADALFAERTRTLSVRFGTGYVDVPALLAGTRGTHGPDGCRLTLLGHALVAAELVRELNRHVDPAEAP
jgi:hypothetical protein